MNQMLSSDEMVEGGMKAAATDAVLQPNPFARASAMCAMNRIAAACGW